MDATANIGEATRNTPLSLAELRELARVNRVDTTEMFSAAGNGHFGELFFLRRDPDCLVLRGDACRSGSCRLAGS